MWCDPREFWAGTSYVMHDCVCDSLSLCVCVMLGDGSSVCVCGADDSCNPVCLVVLMLAPRVVPLCCCCAYQLNQCQFGAFGIYMPCSAHCSTAAKADLIGPTVLSCLSFLFPAARCPAAGAAGRLMLFGLLQPAVCLARKAWVCCS